MFDAITPAAEQSARLTLSNPTAWFATILSCGPAAASSSASTFSVSIVMRASRPATVLSRSSRGMPKSFSSTVTSQRSRRRASGASMIGRVTSTLGRVIAASLLEGEPAACHGRRRTGVARRAAPRSWEHRAAMTWHLETERLVLRPMTRRRRRRARRRPRRSRSMRFYPQPFDPPDDRGVDRPRPRAVRRRTGTDSSRSWSGRRGEVVGDCGPTRQAVDGEDFVELGWHVRSRPPGPRVRDRGRRGVPRPRVGGARPASPDQPRPSRERAVVVGRPRARVPPVARRPCARGWRTWCGRSSADAPISR